MQFMRLKMNNALHKIFVWDAENVGPCIIGKGD